MSSDSAGRHAVLGGEIGDRVPGEPKRRRGEVEQVHRHLGPERVAAFGLADLEPVRLELRQPAAGLADAARDAPGEVDVIGIRG